MGFEFFIQAVDYFFDTTRSIENQSTVDLNQTSTVDYLLPSIFSARYPADPNYWPIAIGMVGDEADNLGRTIFERSTGEATGLAHDAGLVRPFDCGIGSYDSLAI